jgi:hypothetical protein
MGLMNVPGAFMSIRDVLIIWMHTRALLLDVLSCQCGGRSLGHRTKCTNLMLLYMTPEFEPQVSVMTTWLAIDNTNSEPAAINVSCFYNI